MISRRALPKASASTTARFGLSVLIGAAVTLAIAALAGAGGLSQLERVMLDWRFRWFDHDNPTPTDRVVHIDIDDGSLKTIGRWPWPRSRMASVVEELRRAGASVVAFDVLFSESQEPRIVPRYAPGADLDAEPDGYDKVDDDGRFAAAMQRANNVLLPIAMKMTEPPTELELAVRGQLHADPGKSLPELREALSMTDAQTERIKDVLASQRVGAIRQRILEMMPPDGSDAPEPSLADVRAAILPKLPQYVTTSTTLSILREQYELVLAMRRMSSHLRPTTAIDAMFSPGENPTVPVLRLADHVVGTGFVTFDANAYQSDGVLRSIPLWMRDSKNLWPQIALAAGCRYLGVPLNTVRITPDATILPDAKLPDGTTRDVVIPMMRRRIGDGWFSSGGQILIPWQSGAPRWQNLFDAAKLDSKQHLPIGVLIELDEARRAQRINERSADVALIQLMVKPPFDSLFRLDLTQRFDKISESLTGDIEPEDAEQLAVQRAELRRRVVEELTNLRKDYESIEALSDAERADLAALVQNMKIFSDAIQQVQLAQQRIADDSARFRQLIDGTVCLVGWTGTGSIADFIPTSLEPKVPGVVVHGALLNAMLTDHFYRRAPVWIDMLMIVLLGLIATVIASAVGPVVAMSLTAGLIVGYFMFNGMLLFDHAGVWAVAAGPSLAAVGAWTGVTVFRLMAEQRGRARITRQFKNYVAPDLVDYLVDNPNVIKLEGERRELTCAFSDIAGFTTISEILGPEGTVNLLNKYLALATDALMNHRATVNKYLGDGIMAFWGAPIHNADHALDACHAVLALLEAGRQLADDPDLEDLPKLHTRIGICTGIMMVGDCGAPPRRSDYTVIGDAVNLSSRLENANKQFDTQILISDRTCELVRDQMLTRPVGRLIVVGRHQYEVVHELLNSRIDATAEQHNLAEATTAAVEAYIAADFARARDLFNALAEQFGSTRLIDRYLDAIAAHIQNPPTDFDGTLILTAK